MVNRSRYYGRADTETGQTIKAMNIAVWVPSSVVAKATAIGKLHGVSRGTVLRRFIVEGIQRYEANLRKAHGSSQDLRNDIIWC